MSISFKNTAIDLLGGTCGGMLQAVVGHPLDLIKARMQSSVSSETIMQAITHIGQTEGVRGFYRGISPPLAMAGFLNAVIFTTNTFFKRIVAPTDPISGEKQKLSLFHIVIASWLTTPVYCSVLAPVEIIKVRMQLQSSGAVAHDSFSGPLDCVRQIVKKEGVRGLYSGFVATLGTRFIGLPFYFGGFELSKQSLMEWRKEEQASTTTMLIAGGVGGIAFWGANFPVDLLKTNMQATGAQGGTLIQTIQRIYIRSGIRGFYRGIMPCLIRSVPANSVAFFGYEKTVQLLRQN